MLSVAIPLVDPCFELLHIHFVVDPGPDFVWGRDLKDAKKVKAGLIVASSFYWYPLDRL